jgi:competence protein ComEA
MADRNKALELVRKLIQEGEHPTEDKFSAVWDATALRDWYAGCQRLSGYLDKDSPFKKDLVTRPDAKNLWDDDAHSTMLACLKQVEEELASPEAGDGTRGFEGKAETGKAVAGFGESSRGLAVDVRRRARELEGRVAAAKAEAEDRCKSTVKRPIDVNAASEEELCALHGIGPVIAKRISDGRPYHSVDDLIRVDGIGEVKLAAIRREVVVKA